MGRLPVVISGLVCACQDARPAAGNRSEQVIASATSSASASVAHGTAVAAPRGPLCDSVRGRQLPKGGAAVVDAAGGVSDRGALATGRARWVSLFASWCGPCKEELPRIQRFAHKLEADGVPIDVTVVSLDDDLRQLTAFLSQQPDGGLKSAYWLKEGAMRTSWLLALKLAGDVPLPEHGLFDARGQLRCWVAGAIEETDYPQLLATLTQPGR